MFISSLNDLFAIVLFGSIIGFYATPENIGGSVFLPWEKLPLSLLLGILMGSLFLLLFRTRMAEADRTLVIIGLVLFGGGMSYLLKISPLLLYLVAGAVMANFSSRKEEAFQLLLRIEKPLYLIFLMISGAYLHLEGPHVILFVLLYSTVRAASHVIGGRLFLQGTFQSFIPYRFRGSLGWGLLSQGGIAVALAIHCRLWFPYLFEYSLFELVFSVLLVGILLNELIAPFGFYYAISERKE